LGTQFRPDCHQYWLILEKIMNEHGILVEILIAIMDILWLKYENVNVGVK